jgi:hypothetical protein|tara:strand:- start:15283 stop:17682 length:2400 start_codon:yes stop_codon:yes gene_type:complete
MANVTRPTTPLPSPGDEMMAEQVTDWINNILGFIESNSIDEDNVNLTATKGIMGLSTAQDVKGLKTFTSTSTASGAQKAIEFALHPNDNTVSTNDGVRTAYQVYSAALSALHDFGYIDCIATDLTGGSEDGKFIFYLYKNGTATEAFSITGDGPAFNTDITIYEDANGADVTISMGTSATESFNIIADNGGSNKTLEKVIFRSKTASGTANHGHMSFEVDETEIATIKDDGIHVAVGGIKIADDKTLTFGSDGNYTVEYDEDGTDKLIVSSAVDGAALSIILQADRGDDAGDEWLLNIADGGVLTLGNDKASAGTHDNGKLTLTAHATASTLDFGGNATLYNDVNNADVSFAMGTSATESFNIITSNGASDKELYQVDFTTKTAESDADRGKFVFNVDETAVATIDDDGIELETGKTFKGASLTNLGMLYSNSGVITALTTIQSDGSSLNVGASGGSAGATLNVYGNTSGSVVNFSSSTDTATFQKYGVVHLSSATDTPIVQIKNTYNDATAGTLRFINDRGAAGQDNDVCGTIDFFGDDDNQDNIRFAQIQGIVADASNGAEGGKLTLSVASHDGEINTGLIITDGSAEDEVDVTIGNGTASVTTTTGNFVATGSITAQGITVGEDGTGYDVQFFGDTSGSSVLFDESADDMVLTNYGIAVGSDATGDIYYRNASGFLARLGKGTTGHYLKQGSSIPEWAAVSAGSGEYNAWAVKTTTYTASTKDQLIANHASTAFTITLPSSPSAGNTVTIKNVGAATVTIGRNSEKINSEAADGTLFTGSAVQLVYVDSTIGWTTL